MTDTLKRTKFICCGFSHLLLSAREKQRQTTVAQPVSKIPAYDLTRRLMSMQSTVFRDLEPSSAAAVQALSDQVSQQEAVAY